MTIEIREEAGVRTLHFGSDWIQGAMRIARPWALELAYTRDMLLSLLFHEQEVPAFPEQVLQIGLGSASLTKFIHRHGPQTVQTIVEIDPAVRTAARQFFKLPEESRHLKLVIDDGALFVQKSVSLFDLMLIDGFDENAKAGALETAAFYQCCRARLAPGGILAINVVGGQRRLQHCVRQLNLAFEQQTLVLPACDSGNRILFAFASVVPQLQFPTLRDKASRLKKFSGLDLLPTLARLEQHLRSPSKPDRPLAPLPV